MLEGIHWLPTTVASLIPILLGGLWYGKLFGQIWQQETGITEEVMKAHYNPARFFGGTIAGSFVAAIFLAKFMADCQLTGAKAFAFGCLDGATIAAMTVLPAMAVNSAIWEHKSWRYVAVNAGFWVISFALMAGVLNVWK